MSYELDGIETAFVDGRETGAAGFLCPCGWKCYDARFPGRSEETVVAALRFHFTHCPQAKLPTPEDET